MPDDKPSLLVTRLMVTGPTGVAYDEHFHTGVNIIRGVGSSGKSTIAHLLFYGLGGESIDWKPEVWQVEHVCVEIDARGSIITLRRRISKDSLRPMFIFWGSLDDSIEATPDEWDLYPYRHSSNNRNFSDVLFEAMGMPEVRGELDSWITMNALLRFLYVDQESPSSSLFRQEPFDSPTKRRAIGDVLCGVYDNDLYASELKLRELKSKIADVNQQISVSVKFLAESETPLSREALRERLADAEANAKQLEISVDEGLNSDKIKAEEVRKENKKKKEDVRKQLISARKEYAAQQDSLASLEFEIADSKDFLTALREKRASLDDANVLDKVLSEITFQYCPACFKPLGDSKPDEEQCHLCRAKQDGHPTASHLARYRSLLTEQIRESEILLDAREERAAEAKVRMPAARRRLAALTREYDHLVSDAQDSISGHLRNLIQELGYTQREIKAIDEKVRLVSQVEQLEKAKADLDRQVSQLQMKIDRLVADATNRRNVVARAVEGIACEILRNDQANNNEKREDTFASARKLDVDFEGDSFYVNGRKGFSASSMVILRNAVHLAFLFASLELDFMRLPCFFMSDDVDGGGMEDSRSHNLQRMILSLSESYDLRHQIIITTSKLAPDLDVEHLTVGRSFTKDQKSLRNVKSITEELSGDSSPE